MPLTDTECQLLTVEIQHIKNAVDEIKAKLNANYVTKDEFWPVAKIAYSAVAIMGLTVLAALLKLIIRP